MMMQNYVTFIPGDAIVGLACLAMTPISTAGYWYEVSKCPAKSIWVEIKPITAFVVYKDDEKCP